MKRVKSVAKKGWNPVKDVSKVVEGMVKTPSRQGKESKQKAKVEHERVVLYLTPSQAYNLRKAALDAHTDTSTMARDIFKKAGV